ncbi:glycosyltransferase [Nereida sp. MMG025]|uniref:glycosyltransferase family 4 protein n=1 Tax=Nereida sp. MMG025 TaxID=2909981 RepID=UPI00351CD4A5
MSAPYKSQGVGRRLGLLFWAYKLRTDINHISGDIQFVALALPKKNTILTIHDIERLRHLNGFRGWIYKKLWFEWPMKRVAQVTTISEKTRSDLVEIVGFDRQKIEVIHNPISTAFVPNGAPFNSSNPRILHIGTRENKNLERVIEAVSTLPCTLVIIGHLSDAQRGLLAQHDVVFDNHFDLTDEEIVAQYQSCDMVAFPSLFEGFGLVAVEGQACAKPVVTSFGSPFDEVVGQTACLVDPKDVMSIRNGIQKVIEDTAFRDDLISLGLKNAKRFSPDVVARQYEQIYTKIGT